ncbi:MAG: ABC transporter ATP-binding protein [Gemmatimonadetes bacterium]|nr:ABC transporter ATP-binding protein [Gemmatimonadota bacterium]MBT8405400.1 ABC transporter ATP-binding protein [Gemmatimonadota bacterium]NNF37822.1 ABC transporter ATP-binding protein [Gemmatimonadota bacterium]NNK64447.1 ABC transporter ATP-binding protein [Gemmatimonadota bacterium]
MSIRFVDLEKRFGDNVVLDGFSLEVPDGDITTIIGPSGSGKSTCLKTVIGLIRPDAGEVWVDERRVDTLEGDPLYEVRRTVGFVFQFAALFDSMTIFDNVAMGLRRTGELDEAAIGERVRESLDLVDLEGVEDKMPSQLSGGMRKRAGVARAVALRPQYLLYDEPTTGLDPVTVTVIDRLILRMRDELGVTSLVITHDLESAYRVSDRLAMLHQGRIRWVGAPEAIRDVDDPAVQGFIRGEPELWEEAS